MPVDSIATCVQPAAVSQPARRSSSGVVVPNVRTCWRRCGPSPGARRQAVTLAWCTSRAQQTGKRTSIDPSLSAQDGEALTARKILRVLYRGRYATVRGAGQRLGPDSDGLSGTILQPTSTPSLHPATLPRGFSCAAGDPSGSWADSGN